MNKQTISIGFLSITALILFIAQFLPVQPVAQGAAIKDRDYALITSPSARGGDTVYVIDNRTGMVAVLIWNSTTRSFDIGPAAPLANAFR